ncbi:BCL2 associated agonist of cell death b [Nematolebias whitei]|uniref:BCL2 associated agonist of cell death b n=1 Tax=Nematolebias whitei TaxID=451745 RepID=UPI00189B7DC9|nr:BCL2 associated agonist of cell death b [Nematolebias whitei]
MSRTHSRTFRPGVVETSDVTMAANFTISDSDSEPSEEVEEAENKRPSEGQENVRRHLNIPELRLSTNGRIRLNSESHLSTVYKEEDLLARGEEEPGTPTEGYPFRGRSKSAPPALWAAKKYGQRLRRMSDEFDSLLDKGEMRKVKSVGSTKPIPHTRSWWNYLFSHQESDGENGHHEKPTHRTE